MPTGFWNENTKAEMTDQTYRSDRISAPGVGRAQTSVRSHSWFEKVQPWTVGRAVRLNPTYTTKSSKAHNLVKPGSSSHGESVWGETMVRITKGLWWEFSYTAIPTRSSTPHQKVINNLCSVKTEGQPAPPATHAHHVALKCQLWMLNETLPILEDSSLQIWSCKDKEGLQNGNSVENARPSTREATHSGFKYFSHNFWSCS